MGKKSFATIGLIAVLALASCASNDAPAVTSSSSPAPVVTESASSQPTPTESTDVEFTLESMEIPAGLDAQAYSEALVNRQNVWSNASATLENQQKSIYASNEFSTIIASENAELGADALFTEKWRNDRDLVKQVGVRMEINATTIQNWFLTYEENPSTPKVAYQYEEELEEVKILEESESSRTIELHVTLRNNAEETSIAAYAPNLVADNGSRLLRTITTETEGDSEKITKYTTTFLD